MTVGFPDDDAWRRLLEQQAKIAEAFANNDALQRAFAQQAKIAEAFANNDALQRAFAQQAKIAETFTSSGAITQILKQQGRLATQLNSPTFRAYRVIAAEAIESVIEMQSEDLTDPAEVRSLLEGRVPSKEEAQGLVDIVTFLIALIWLLLTATGTEIPETTQRGVDAALAFAVVMTRFGRK